MLYFIVVYIIGYFLTLFILHRFKKELGVDCYDKKSMDLDEYDDYESNAEAYVSWSLFWPLLIIAGVVVLIWKFLIWTSRKMEK